MDSCKNYKDKIIFFDDMNENEKRDLLSHVESCDSCRAEFHTARAIAASLANRASAHQVSDESLQRYAVQLSTAGEPDYDGERLSPAETTQIENHLEICGDCRKKLEDLQKEFLAIDAHLDEMEFPNISIERQAAIQSGSLVTRLKRISSIFSRPRIPAVLGAVAALVAVWLSPFFRGGEHPYKNAIALDSNLMWGQVRGGGEHNLDRARIAFDQQNYQQVVVSAEAFIADNPGSALLHQAWLIKGVSQLRASQTNIWGRFYDFDSMKLAQSVEALKQALALAANELEKEESRWFLAQANLALKDGEKAKLLLTEIVAQNGRRYNEAKRLLETFE